jgi:hypothetical protein
VVGLVCFVAGRWSVTSDVDRKVHPQPPPVAKESVVPKEMGKVVAKSGPSKPVHAGGGGATAFRPPASMKNSAGVAPSATPVSSSADTESMEPKEEALLLVQNSPEVVKMQAEHLAQLKEELTSALQESGFPEDEIKLQVESLEASMTETDSFPSQGPVGEVSPELMAEEIAASLRQSGMSDEEIESAMEGFLAATVPEEPEQ